MSGDPPLEDPIVRHCIKFWNAIGNGDLYSFTQEWAEIQKRRVEYNNRSPEFWNTVWHDIQKKCGNDWQFAVLVSNIRDGDLPEIKKTNYYVQCVSNHEQLQKRGRIRMLPNISKNPKNPYTIELIG